MNLGVYHTGEAVHGCTTRGRTILSSKTVSSSCLVCPLKLLADGVVAANISDFGLPMALEAKTRG